jgi:hypothetical protein
LELKNFFVQDDQGNKLPGAACYLYQRGTETQATGLRKANGVSLMNPFTADHEGLVQFAAPNGLYDLRIVSGDRDNRIQVQFNDVSEDLATAKVAADRAEVARDSAQLSAGIFSTTAEGLAATSNGKYFSVVSVNSTEYLILYRNTAGVAIEIDRYPNATAISDVSKLVQNFESANSEAEILVITDGEGAQHATLTNKRLQTPSFDLATQPGVTAMGDSEGGVAFYADDERVIVGQLEMRYTDLPGMFVTDNDGNVFSDLGSPGAIEAPDLLPEPLADPLTAGVLFTPLVVTSGDDDITLYSESLLHRRELVGLIKTTLASTTTPEVQSGPALKLNALRMGPQGVINLRQASISSKRRTATVEFRNVPVQDGTAPIKVLLLGDSISNFQGAYLIKQQLEALGFLPTFVGTLNGSATESTNNASGPLGEPRSGWKASDYTYRVIDRAQLVAPGDEAAYMAMTKSVKATYNPFLRPATGDDSPSITRNGQVFDCAFYASRFGVAAPDVVINLLGTNDIKWETADSVYDAVNSDDLLIHAQILAAWPSAKILRSIPGTARGSRDALWNSHYSQAIKAMRAAAVTIGSRVTVAPLWAMTDPDGGYPGPTSTPGADGFAVGDWYDPIHPSGAARVGLYRALTPYIAAQKLNII